MTSPALFTPFSLGQLPLKNRIIVPPMCQYSALDGHMQPWHLMHLGSLAVSGSALVFIEATAVEPAGRISPADVGLWDDATQEAIARTLRDIRSFSDTPFAIQLAHAGRKASHTSPWNGNRQLTAADGGWQTLAPSAVAYREDKSVPVAMSRAQIRQVITDFSNAARRAFEAGFEVFEIHAAHGYLINEFLSPLSNFRDDEYGGSFENRIRLLLETVQEIRRVIPDDLPLFVRISATEWTVGGWNEADSIKLAIRLKTLGVDLIDCSAGGNSPKQQITAVPLYQVPFAAAIRKEAGILTGAVGLITQAGEAEQLLRDKQADLVFMGRQLLRDPYFPLQAAKQLGADVAWPVQYERAK